MAHHTMSRVRSILSKTIMGDADIGLLAPSPSPAISSAKRTFSEYKEDISLKERMLPYQNNAHITPATHPATRVSPPRKGLLIHPTEEYKARRRAEAEAAYDAAHPGVIRRIGGMFTSVYGGAFAYTRAIWGYITQKPQQQEEIIAVETDSNGKKRRAVSSSPNNITKCDSAPSQNNIIKCDSAPSQNTNMAATTQFAHIMPGTFPSELDTAAKPTTQPLPITEPEPEPTKPQATKPHLTKPHITKPKLITPPDSRPTSSHLTQPNIQTTSNQQDVAPAQTGAYRYGTKKFSRLPSYARVPTKKLAALSIEPRLQKAEEIIASPPGKDELSLSWRTRIKAEEELQAAKKAEEAEKTKQKVEEEDPDDFSSITSEELEKETLIRKLPPDWAAKVDHAMAKKDKREILATTVDGTDLTRHDFGCLLPQKNSSDHMSGWLNDEIVNGFISAIVERKNEQHKIKRGQTPKYASYATAWYTNFKKTGIKGIETWSRRKQIKGEKLLGCDIIFFPVNTGAHWMLLIIEPKKRTISFLDSLRQISAKKKFFGIAREWLKMELKEKYQEQEWKESEMNESEPQLNEDDCGVYVCFNALIAAKNYTYHELAYASIADGRKLMAAILMAGGFRGDWEL
jgi:hypothetical protein